MDEFAEDILHWPSNIYCVSDVSMYYLAKSVLLLITDTPVSYTHLTLPTNSLV